MKLLSPTLGGSLGRLGLLAQRRVASFQAGTARHYLEYQALRVSLDLFKPGAFVPWVSYLFPPEILASYGLVPLIPEIAATTLLGTELRGELAAAINRSALSRDVCSYHRAAHAALEIGLLPAPSACLGTTPLCLGSDRLLDELAARSGVPHAAVHVALPPDEGPAGPEVVTEVAEELRRVHEALGRWTGRQPRLARAVDLSNRAAAAWAEITEARLQGHLLLDGRQAFAFNFVGQVLRGSEAGARGFEKLLRERGRRDLVAPPGARPRLLWLHTMPHFDHSLVELLRRWGGVVAFEEMARMQLDQVDREDPFPGLARRLLEHPLWGTSSRRARLVTELATRMSVDGVLHFNHWGCRQGLGSVPVLRKSLHEAGIPFLALDGDALDSPGSAEDGVVGQLESFLELL